MPKVKDIPFLDHYQNEFKHSVPMPSTTKYNEVAAELQKQMGRLIATPPDPVKTVAADYDKAVTAILTAK